MLTIAVVYAIISLLTFSRYNHERLTDRIALSILAPIVPAWVVMEWVVARVEELG